MVGADLCFCSIQLMLRDDGYRDGACLWPSFYWYQVILVATETPGYDQLVTWQRSGWDLMTE